jgi:FlaA1/EpsC-like NDP-sugar epimerase
MIKYLRFAAMIGTSTVIMYGLMYLNTYATDHLYWSETRAYMALIMGSTMAVVMLLFMLHMYRNKAVNVAILAMAGIVFASSLYMVRSQASVDQLDWMKAMIPHHSIAILTSERAGLDDPRVRALADEIVATQRQDSSDKPLRKVQATRRGG